MAEDNKLMYVGDSLLISLVAPYLNVKQVLGYEDSVTGEDSLDSLNKEFRWSVDGATYSDYIELNVSNLRALQLNPKNPFWIQYRYTVISIQPDHEIVFNSITLEVLTEKGTLKVVPQYECCTGDSPNACNNLIVECCSNTAWNPYDIGSGINTYKSLSKIVSDMFGFCVNYYKTEADQRSSDVILKEYTLFNVIKSDEVKILVPDNALPTREIQFDPLGLDYAMDTFEIHIVKSSFEQVFGLGSRPEQGDYLYFPIMNKLYEVNSISRPDDFMYSSSYWRVGLITYQERQNFDFSNQNIEDEVKSMIENSETEFEPKAEQEEIKVRKPKEYNTIGTQNNDYIRRILDKKLIIKEEKIYNNWTIIGKFHYKLSSITTGAEALTYRYEKGISDTDDRAFTFWFRPGFAKPQYQNVVISSLADDGGFLAVNTATPHGYKIGDLVVLEGTTSYDGISIVKDVVTNGFTTETPYFDSTLRNNPKVWKEESCKFLQYGSDDFYVTFTQNFFVIKAADNVYSFDLRDSVKIVNNNYYAAVINFSNTFDQISLFIYQSVVSSGLASPEKDADLVNVFAGTLSLGAPVSVTDGLAWKLLGCNTDLTNIRIFTKPIEVEEQSLVLCQFVVNDNNLADLIDNASPQLQLVRVSNSR